jgi:hypothetical protein
VVVVLSCHAVSTTAILWQDQYYYLPLQKISARNYKIQSCITSDEHIHLRWCEQLPKHKFPQCAPADLETSCLLEIGDFSRKLQLRCCCQFPLCALALKVWEFHTLAGRPPQQSIIPRTRKQNERLQISSRCFFVVQLKCQQMSEAAVRYDNFCQRRNIRSEHHMLLCKAGVLATLQF